VVIFDGLDDSLEVFQTDGDVFQQELVLDGQAVKEDVVDGKGAEHPVLGRVVAECFGVADVILVLLVAFDADAEHVVDGLSEAVKGGAGEGAAVVNVIGNPKMTNVFEVYLFVA
jgi:hypothetical protein